ncbi:hypothetical protein H8356DRAFT_1436123 [Neocallimastix lanati (nom. inval.)]|nr:hypothetical protein H8356DRAFT_1436123 [Neocallimastix sp. JGI-2020a]
MIYKEDNCNWDINLNTKCNNDENSKQYKIKVELSSNKCKIFIILYGKRDILKYEKFNVSISTAKHKFKEEIKKSSTPFEIKRKRIFNKISQKMGFICLENINKQLAPDEIPDKYYKTKRDESFAIFKNSNTIIFQYPFQVELFSKYYDILIDGTFYAVPNFKQTTYEILLEEMKEKKSSKYYNNIVIEQKIFHCDFEIRITNAAEKVFHNINIKY